MIEDFDQCYRAAASRDRRFDGRFITAVTSTGIYCRPSCPAQTPRRENVRFYAVAAAAQAAGFRACKRCRPQASPGSPDWDIRADLAGRALRLIADGVVDDSGIGGLAKRLSVSERHLHRLLVAEVGAGPLALARTRRAQTARLLIDSTPLPLTDIAFTAGYSSVRQFNDSIREAFGCTPSYLRERSAREPSAGPATGAIVLRLALRPPYDGAAWLAWLAARAVPGLEELTDTSYRRSIRLPRSIGIIELTPGEDHVSLRLSAETLADLAVAVSRSRALGDLNSDPETVAEVLGLDPLLAPAVAAHPGLRVPGHVDGFELSCRAVIGQQITVAGARTLLGRLTEALGAELSTPDGDVTRLFPTPTAVAESELDGLGFTGARRRTLRTLAAAVASGDLQLDRGADREQTVRDLLALPGIGPWTASYIAMRALGDPDAFPASDLGLLRSSRALGGPATAAELEEHSGRWRPWRAYAAQHLWTYESE
jgi:AraC family transcriptional regulator of adaptative response / DNA-3-methyladenine glycosylase II